MEIIVQKYGGTSVNTEERREHIAKNAKDAIKNGASPVIVVSAMGRYPSPYATDTLLSLISEGCEDKRLADMIATCGEIISAVAVASQLKNAGVPAYALSGQQAGILTDSNFGEAEIKSIDPSRILALINEGYVPVVAGFQGADEQGSVTTLGRGGSDTSATALGAALNADKVEIYTDVDGIMSADPNVVSEAEIFSEVEYNDVFLLASSGAKVIHPRAVEYAKKANIEIDIINVNKSRDSDHTVIKKNVSGNKMFNAVTSLSHCVQVKAECAEIAKQDEMLTKLALAGISIDMINIFGNKSVFIINEEKLSELTEILEAVGVGFTAEAGFSKVTAMGEQIHGIPGVMAKMIASLYANKIEVFQTSDSNKTISLLVKAENAQNAVNLLHELIFH